jgi:hypothetical protein
MGYIELLIGFDAREIWYFKDVKDMDARSTGSIGFLRDEVKKGLTVDTSIWGSVFDTGDCVTLKGEKRKEFGLGTLKLPDWIGPNKPFWENLIKLEKYLEENDSKIIKPYWIIAVTRISRPQEVKNKPFEWPYFEKTEPNAISSEWKLIGYDIADEGGESHLTGIGFRGDEQYLKSLCNRWGHCLNEYHLFRSLTDANEYKEYESQHEPDRAPYYVYGIWLIKKIEK